MSVIYNLYLFLDTLVKTLTPDKQGVLEETVFTFYSSKVVVYYIGSTIYF